MGKITNLPQALSFDEGDVLVKDGEHGTKQIPVSEAAKYMGRDTVMINEQPTEGTKIVIQTTGQEYSLALMSDVDAVDDKVEEVKTQFNNYDDYVIGVKDLIGNATYTPDKYLDDSGEEVAFSGFHYSSLIPVESGVNYIVYIRAGSTTNNVRIHGYDSNGDWVEMLQKQNVGPGSGQTADTVKTVAFTVPSTVAYIRVSSKTDKTIYAINGFESNLFNKINDNHTAIQIDANNLQNIFTFSDNLVIKENSYTGKVISDITGIVRDYEGFNTSEYIKVKPNTEYSCKYVYRIAYYDLSQNFISVTTWNEQGVDRTFSTGNAEYVRISYESNFEGYVILNIGDSVLDYEKGYKQIKDLYMNYKGVEIVENNLENIFDKSANLIVLENALANTILTSGTGVAREYNNFETSEYIKIDPNSQYSFKYIYRVALYDINQKYISDFTYNEQAPDRTIDSGNAEYIRASWGVEFHNSARLNKGSVVADYVKGYKHIKEWYIKKAIEDTLNSYAPLNNNYFYFVPRIPCGVYKAPVCEGYPATSHYTDTIALSDIYDVYDDMVENNPEYVTRTLLGKDQTGTYDIYKYEFNPVEASSTSFTATYPKIMVITNLHGEEKGSTIGLMNLMNDICTNWKNDDMLQYLRWNVHFIVVPIVNPWGFVNHTKVNGNNVDLARNFDYNWNSTPDSEDHPKGSAPFSEKESQYVRDIVLANPDLMHFADYHMNGNNYVNGEWFRQFWFYLSSFTPVNKGEIEIVAKSSISDMTAAGQSRYDVPQNSGILGMITYYGQRYSTPALWAYSLGISSFVVEATCRIIGETQTYTAKCNQFNTEFTGNWILNLLRQKYRTSIF